MAEVGQRADATDLYLDLLKRMLTRYGFEPVNGLNPIYATSTSRSNLAARINRLIRPTGVQFGLISQASLAEREEGLDWPSDAETMIGLKRMQQLHDALDTIRREDIPGDLMETGVWRGGAVIFMTAYLRVYGMHRTVFAADSFEGLPPPDPRYPVDAGDQHHAYEVTRVSLEQVKANFAKYDIPTDDVVFIKGFFADTMPTAPVDDLALLRLDGDMYSSTIEVLETMYPKVNAGGFVIVDDYFLTGARTAVHDYLQQHGEDPEIHRIDVAGAYWRKASA